ncbi:hypothetical protein [Bradyrhizobium vignae]|uniref:Uncharacterized protein n=1 Tax=Bradyrhizobium vignae TaxID=1549949 RepID=A0A2U3PXC8_9BRAD|nr:hypothetical protein [Bradyrhizobium vignae]MBP0113763.1 hypothetical protein [Bradyrhizobium vignae]SPP93810.1 protein of unknown function [Bradyrhizobium vignae]
MRIANHDCVLAPFSDMIAGTGGRGPCDLSSSPVRPQGIGWAVAKFLIGRIIATRLGLLAQ